MNHDILKGAANSGILRRPINFFGRILFYNRHVALLQFKVREHLMRKYGDILSSYRRVEITLQGEVTIVEEYSRRVYVPPTETFKISSLTQSILFQEIIRKSSLQEIYVYAPQFVEAIIAFETTSILLKEENGEQKAQEHHARVKMKNDSNPYLNTIKTINDSGDLKKVVGEMISEISKVPIPERMYNPVLSHQLKEKVERIQKDALKRIKLARTGKHKYDSFSNDQIIKEVKKLRKNKKIKDLDHQRTAEEIVDAILQSTPIRSRKNTLLSYYHIMAVLVQSPGQTVGDLSKTISRHPSTVLFAIFTLLSEGNGLGLIESKIENDVTKFYPSQEFNALMEQRKILKKQS